MSVSESIASDHVEDLALLEQAALEAGDIAMSFFGKEPEVWMKPGDSPVSEGDLAVNAFLEQELMNARPDYGWLSEETAVSEDRLTCKRTFVVDPIDGTRAYIGGKDIWCVSIAIVEDGRPVAGVLQCPALQEVFLAVKGGGATLNGLQMQPINYKPDVAIAGPPAMHKAMARVGFEGDNFYPHHIPSLAYRIAMIAKGDISAGFARPRSHDWDIAAADLLLEEVGGVLHDVEDAKDDFRTKYNQPQLRHGVLLGGAKSSPSILLDVAKSMAIHQ